MSFARIWNGVVPTFGPRLVLFKHFYLSMTSNLVHRLPLQQERGEQGDHGTLWSSAAQVGVNDALSISTFCS